MKVQKPKRLSLSLQIVQEMERIIRSSQWKVGDRIPAEPELMELFGVSRNTVREAVQSLIHAGLLIARPGDGTYVMGRDRLEVLFHNRLMNAEFRKVLEARLLLEPGIAELAAQNRTEADLRAIRKALADRECGRVDPDVKFHIAVAHAAHNPLLTDFYNEICRYLQKNILDSRGDENTKRIENDVHARLVEAIANGDCGAAREITRRILTICAEYTLEKPLEA